MPVYFRGDDPDQDCYLTPAPFVNIDKNYERAGDGQILGARYVITLEGSMVADRGSPSTHEGATNGFLTDSADKIIDDHVHAHSYTDIMKKQQLMRKLFSKRNDGGILYISAPFTGGATISCHVEIIGVTFPQQTPGNVLVQPYTITFETSALNGAGITDPDDMSIKHQLVSSASENWDIQENNDRNFINHKDDGGFKNTYGTYTVTHTISATGRRKFSSTNRGMEAEKFGRDAGRSATDGFFNKLDDDGQAWEQARDFCRRKLMHGVHIHNPSSSDGIDLTRYGANIPWELNDEHDLTGATIDGYYAFNYTKTESIGEMDGTFSVTETFDLLPQNTIAIETMEIQKGGDAGHGKSTVTITGTIEGVNLAPVIDGKIKTANSTHNLELSKTTNNGFDKFSNAKTRLGQIKPILYPHAREFTGDTNILPTPVSSNITRNPSVGTINYSYTFENRKYYIPFCRAETVTLTDTYPGHVIAQHQVIGRKTGPVLQDIGTQGPWKRNMSINCVVDVDSQKFCVDSGGDRTLHENQTDCEGVSGNTWATNPNYIAVDYSDANAKKPSMVNTAVVGTLSQRTAIRNVVNTFKPDSSSARAIFADSAPSETWDPQSGAWSYSIGWTYELEESYICNEDVDNIAGGDNNYPGTPK